MTFEKYTNWLKFWASQIKQLLKYRKIFICQPNMSISNTLVSFYMSINLYKNRLKKKLFNNFDVQFIWCVNYYIIY